MSNERSEMIKFIYLKDKIINLNEIEFIDDEPYDTVIVHMKSGKTITLNASCSDVLMKSMHGFIING